MKKTLILIGISLLLAGCNFLGLSANKNQVACDMDAKLCPDGSAVGRSGPNCEFAPCPEINSILSEVQARAIAEKSCIKGGEALSAGTYNENSKTWWFDANLNATKEGCNPACVVNEDTKTAEINWRCTGLIVPDKSEGTISGQILLGPTCSVVKNPPDPSCADKPYQTSIQIFDRNSPQAAPYKVIQNDAQGNYSVTLPVGEYNFQPAGGSVMPRCTAQDVTVTVGDNLKIDFNCDSGIR